jgi:uncharacterized membrane protein YhaH (DUF805 family)
MLYHHPSKSKFVSPAELDFINSDPVDPAEATQKVSWIKVLTTKETWAYAIGKFLIDPVWWMFLFWLPDFLARTYNMDLKSFGLPLVVIYLISDVGSVGGGWISSTLMHRGMSANAARKTAMLICACLALPVFFAASIDNVWMAVIIIGVATAAHQGFSANLYTLPGDVFPRSAVGSVIGIGGAAGGIGGLLFSNYVGKELERLGGYQTIFLVAGTTYLLALLLVHIITPKLAPARLGRDFSGRSHRLGFLGNQAVVVLVAILLTVLSLSLIEFGLTPLIIGILCVLIGIPLILVTLASAARRLHDLGRSGWWSLLALVPGIGLIFIVALALMPGQNDENRFGPSPLAPAPQPT